MPASAGAHRPLRLVLDTNIVVAGFLWSGPPRRLIEWAIEGAAVELFSSPVLLDELSTHLGLHEARRSHQWLRYEHAGTGDTLRGDGVAGSPTCGPKGRRQ